MIKIEVKYLNIFHSRTGKGKEVIEFDRELDLQGLLNYLEKRYGEVFINQILTHRGLNPHIWVLVNGKRVKDLNYKLINGDVVAFSLPVSGGEF